MSISDITFSKAAVWKPSTMLARRFLISKNTTTRITENGIVTSSACMMSQSCTLMTGRGNSSSVTTSFKLVDTCVRFFRHCKRIWGCCSCCWGCCTLVTRSVSLVSRAALVAVRHTPLFDGLAPSVGVGLCPYGPNSLLSCFWLHDSLVIYFHGHSDLAI